MILRRLSAACPPFTWHQKITHCPHQLVSVHVWCLWFILLTFSAVPEDDAQLLDFNPRAQSDQSRIVMFRGKDLIYRRVCRFIRHIEFGPCTGRKHHGWRCFWFLRPSLPTYCAGSAELLRTILYILSHCSQRWHSHSHSHIEARCHHLGWGYFTFYLSTPHRQWMNLQKCFRALSWAIHKILLIWWRLRELFLFFKIIRVVIQRPVSQFAIYQNENETKLAWKEGSWHDILLDGISTWRSIQPLRLSFKHLRLLFYYDWHIDPVWLKCKIPQG